MKDGALVSITVLLTLMRVIIIPFAFEHIFMVNTINSPI